MDTTPAPTTEKVLSGHTSPETAYLVDDYPYGFRLRCKIRYWLEFKKSQGYRLVSQTTNPKQAGEVWNKPKASTYSSVAAVMFLDEQDHVQHHGVGQYSSTEWCERFLATYGEALTEEGRERVTTFTRQKQAYDKAIAEGRIKWVVTSAAFQSGTTLDPSSLAEGKMNIVEPETDKA